MSKTTAADAKLENFADLLAESFAEDTAIEGSVVKGQVVEVTDDYVTIDVGLKSEGRVPLREFAAPGQDAEIQAGDSVEVYVERMEDRDGAAMLSREKARREEAWIILENAFEAQDRVTGIIFGRVKGGFTVDLSGATAFLPGSQVDIRPIHDIGPLMGTPQPFQILKIDRRRGNIVVSRRSVLEESRAEARSELVSNLQEGQVLQGVVKNITDYGAFVDLGGVDGLLHVTDIAWKRINHPSEALQVGQTVDVQVIRFNSETQRISLGMKQLLSDPWSDAAEKFVIGSKLSGRVTNITDYGAFVEVDGGLEGLVHVSEMSWVSKIQKPENYVSIGDEVEVMVLEIDTDKKRLSLGIKQCVDNPWENFAQRNPIGTVLKGSIQNITDFGIFVQVDEGLDGLVHLSDIDWKVPGDIAIKDYSVGQEIEAQILDFEIDKERISLGIKQLNDDPIGDIDLKKGSVVTCTVINTDKGGIDVEIGDGFPAFIKRNDLSMDKTEQDPSRFEVGQKVDAKIMSFDKKSRRVNLSIKSLQISDEKEAIKQYGSKDSGASLGDILGEAFDKNSETQDDEIIEENKE